MRSVAERLGVWLDPSQEFLITPLLAQPGLLPQPDGTHTAQQWKAHLGERERSRARGQARGVRLPGVALRGRRAAMGPGPLGRSAATRARDGRCTFPGLDLIAPRCPARQHQQQEDLSQPGAAVESRLSRGRSHVVPGVT